MNGNNQQQQPMMPMKPPSPNLREMQSQLQNGQMALMAFQQMIANTMQNNRR